MEVDWLAGPHRHCFLADYTVSPASSFDCDSVSDASFPLSKDIAKIPVLKFQRYWYMTVAVPSVGSLGLANWLFRQFPYVTRVTGSLYAARKGSSGLAGKLSAKGELCG